MNNEFRYANNIPCTIKDKLIERETLCEEAVSENSPLSWIVETVNEHKLYTIKKRHLRLTTFSESEIMSLSAEDFRKRILVKDVEDQQHREGK